jgi:hypothetical protein
METIRLELLIVIVRPAASRTVMASASAAPVMQKTHALAKTATSAARDSGRIELGVDFVSDTEVILSFVSRP